MLIAISMPVPVSPIVQPGLTGGWPFSPVTLHVPPEACAIMSKARLCSSGMASPQPLDRAGRQILGEDVGLLDQLLDEFDAARGLEVDRHRFLVGVEDLEIERVVVAGAAGDLAAGIAVPRVLDLDHLGAEPGERLGAGGAGLELGQIDNPNAFQAVKGREVSAHPLVLPPSRRFAGTACPEDTA